MSDTDLSRPFTEFTEEQLLALVRADREREAAEKAATAAPAPAPAPATADPRVAARRAEAQRLLTAQTDQAQLAAEAKALAAAKATEQGYSPSTLDGLTDEELMVFAGLTVEAQNAAAEAAMANDLGRNLAAMKESEVNHLQATWWNISAGQRRELATELGLDYEQLQAEKLAEMTRRGL